ncbi:MAG: type II toxin-antitoxin system VapC family toxin [Promethearchaeota archaeon]
MYCLDSDILIAFLRRDANAKFFLKAHEEVGFGITIITYFELLAGARMSKKRVENEKSVKLLLGRFPKLGFSPKAADICARIYAELNARGTPIGIRDVFIGGICLENRLPIVTRNVGHFRRIKGLEVVPW